MMNLDKCTKKKKSRKGEVNYVGILIVAAITIIVGVILLQASAQQVGDVVNTVSINKTITAPANGGIYNFTSYRALSGVTVYNATDGKLIASGNYTITNNVVSPTTGQLVTQLTVADAQFQSWNWFVIATAAQPLTYADDAGSRAMSSLVIIVFALAIAAVALYPVYGGKLMELLGK